MRGGDAKASQLSGTWEGKNTQSFEEDLLSPEGMCWRLEGRQPVRKGKGHQS